MDRFGRKKVILGKALMCLVTLIPLLPLGFMNEPALIKTLMGFLFLALLFSTFHIDLMLFGFEKLPQPSRVNYVIVLSATRISGIAIITIIFYLTEKWVYFILAMACCMAVLIPLYAKYVYESPLHVMTATADQDWCKSIFNGIAIINEEEIIKEKIYFKIDS
jgi:hypothetical protein